MNRPAPVPRPSAIVPPHSLLPAPAGTFGNRIYEGRVSRLSAKQPEDLFRYERRVRDDRGVTVSTHLTYDLSGSLVVAQQAHHASDYTLQRADMVHYQAGTVTSVEVVGETVRFVLVKGERMSTREERAADPVVAGPTMFGFILRHWDALAARKPVPFRFAVLERSRTIRFVLERACDRDGRAIVRMRPSNLLIRLAVAPTCFEFDPETRAILGYSGRIPPMERVGDRYRAITARVDYSGHAPEFR